MNRMTTPELLTAVGEALHGSHWRKPLADDLDVAMRTVLRWAAGEYEPRGDIRDELRALIAARRKDLAELERRI